MKLSFQRGTHRTGGMSSPVLLRQSRNTCCRAKYTGWLALSWLWATVSGSSARWAAACCLFTAACLEVSICHLDISKSITCFIIYVLLLHFHAIWVIGSRLLADTIAWCPGYTRTWDPPGMPGGMLGMLRSVCTVAGLQGCSSACFPVLTDSLMCCK